MNENDSFTQKISTASNYDLKESAKGAIKWIKDKLQKIFKPRQFFTRGSTPTVGGMYLFVYDPKYKEVLPFYDSHPLVIPIDFYNGGFMGLNLHYLPPLARARLLDSLKKITSNKELSENSKLNISYKTLKAYSTQFAGFENCVKRYLFAHVRSSFHEVSIEEWDKVVLLPLQKWVINSNSKSRESPPY